MSNAAIALSDHFNGSSGGLGFNNTNLSAGTNITTSNSWWTAVTLGTGTLTAASASVKSGHSCKYDTASGGGSSPTADVGITSSTSYVVFEAYWRFGSGAAAPAANFAFLTGRGAGSNRAQIQITTGGNIRIRNNVTAVATSTFAVVQGDFVRLAWELDYTNTTQTLQIYAANDLHNDPTGYTEQISGTFDSGTLDLFRSGYVQTPSGTASMNIDQACISYAGYVGPTFGSFNGVGVSALDEQVATT